MDSDGEVAYSGRTQDIIFFGNANKKLVTISANGTVTIHELGAHEEAAKLFYMSLQRHAGSDALRERIADLERQLTFLRANKRVTYRDGWG